VGSGSGSRYEIDIEDHASWKKNAVIKTTFSMLKDWFYVHTNQKKKNSQKFHGTFKKINKNIGGSKENP